MQIGSIRPTAADPWILRVNKTLLGYLLPPKHAWPSVMLWGVSAQLYPRSIQISTPKGNFSGSAQTGVKQEKSYNSIWVAFLEERRGSGNVHK